MKGLAPRRPRRASAALVCGLALLAAAARADAAPLAPDRYPPPVAALHRAAVDGQADARYDLAIVLLCGTEVPRDPASAALWLALLAPAGHAGAQSVLGWQLMTGTAVLRDDRHAAHWLRDAADHGGIASARPVGDPPGAHGRRLPSLVAYDATMSAALRLRGLDCQRWRADERTCLHSVPSPSRLRARDAQDGVARLRRCCWPCRA